MIRTRFIPISILIFLCIFSSTYGWSASTYLSNTTVHISDSDGLMDSPWPMFAHDVRHTGQSPYSTEDNWGGIKWIYDVTNDEIRGSCAIDNDGIIYFGSMNDDFFALYPNGTLKWKYICSGPIESSPAITEDGTIYFGSHDDYFYALYPNGTIRWQFDSKGSIVSSPAIGDDGTIFFGTYPNYGVFEGRIYALNPNGTEKWHYDTHSYVYQSPAIGDDGIVYCSCNDGHLYALYPTNGTLKWRIVFPPDVSSPSIGSDGTIYVGSWDGKFYAIHPDGTIEWSCNIGPGTVKTPIIADDGTIYTSADRYFFAINPDGTEKWRLDYTTDYYVCSITYAIASEGTVYFGLRSSDGYGGYLVAVYPDGTEKWQKKIAYRAIHSPPVIDEDGAIYVGTWQKDGGTLYAFGGLDPDAPEPPTIDGPTRGKVGETHDYTFTTTSPLGRDVYYYVEWGDGKKTDWTGPYASGEPVTLSHTWDERGEYTIRARAKDTENLWGNWGELDVRMPVSQNIASFPLLRLLSEFLSWFPNLFPVLKTIYSFSI